MIAINRFFFLEFLVLYFYVSLCFNSKELKSSEPLEPVEFPSTVTPSYMSATLQASDGLSVCVKYKLDTSGNHSIHATSIIVVTLDHWTNFHKDL